MAGTRTAKNLRYRRVLLKLSGEALAGAKGYGIDLDVLAPITRDIAAAAEAGAEICLVVGAGNIYRGLMASEGGMDRARADYMGMLATVMNGLALQTTLEREGAAARVLSAIPMPTVCEAYIRDKALDHLAKGRVVIFVGGTGNPYFTTDTAAALRAAEMGCEALLKATQVDGVYSADPRKDPRARRYDRLSFDDVLKQDLRIMDGAAIALARDNRIPIIVFSIKSQGSLPEVLKGKGASTTIDAAGPRSGHGQASKSDSADAGLGAGTPNDPFRPQGDRAPHAWGPRRAQAGVWRPTHRPRQCGHPRPHYRDRLRQPDAAQSARHHQRA